MLPIVFGSYDKMAMGKTLHGNMLPIIGGIVMIPRHVKYWQYAPIVFGSYDTMAMEQTRAICPNYYLVAWQSLAICSQLLAEALVLSKVVDMDLGLAVIQRIFFWLLKYRQHMH